jgi:hypothetical protein
MHNPTDQAESSIPTETVREDPNLNRTFTVCRKAAKRSESWYVAPPPQNIAAPLSIPARKKPRIEEPLATSTDEAATKTASTDISVGLPLPDTPPSTTLRRSSRRVIATSSTGTHVPPPTATTLRRSRRQTQLPARKKPRLEKPLTRISDEAARKTVSPDISVGVPHPAAADNDDASANADPVMDTHDVLDCSVDRAIGRNNSWKEDEDLKLKAAVQTHGSKNWNTIAAMVPGRTKRQCRDRWRDVFDCSVERAIGRKDLWTEDEDLKLKYSVQIHGGKNWNNIAAMVPGRTKGQCNKRWHSVLDPSVALTAGRTGSWTEDEDNKLKAAVQMHGGKNWNKTIAALVPGRTGNQCQSRWCNVLDPSIALTAGSTGAWTEDEDIKLKKAVQMHGGKNWAAIAAMVPGRTVNQCKSRWHNNLDPSVAPTGVRTCTWTDDEDLKLKAAVQTHGGKNWNAIATMVPGRTHKQCYKRWYNVLDPSIALMAGNAGAWTEDEDLKLKAAVETHGGKNWNKIAALVPSRTRHQCNKRWCDVLKSRIALTTGNKGTWTEDEDLKLKAAVQTHGGKDWAAIATMVASRTSRQCNERWHNSLDPSIFLTARRTGTWTEDEDNKLNYAVQMHGGKNWNNIAAMVPGRTKNQCNKRWRQVLDPSIALTTESTGAWREDEDLKLKAAVQIHKNWIKIAAMVPGRTKIQCRDRWKKYRDPNRSTDSPGKRTRHSR